MLADAKYLLAELAIVIFGIAVGFHPTVRAMSLWARASLCLAAGTVALTLEATLFSTLGIPWGLASLGFPLAGSSLLVARHWSAQEAGPRHSIRLSAGIRWGASLCVCAGVTYLLIAFISSAGTSIDYLLFWGVKAVRFAVHRGIDAAFLRKVTASHAVPEYPPLVPVFEGWGYLASDKMPWRIVPVLSAVWLLAAIPILFDRLRRRLSDDRAAALTSFWAAALAVSLVRSGSAGTAEAPLLFFETVTVVWLLTEGPTEPRFVPILTLCGAALTKVEGCVAVACVFLATLLRRERRGWRSALLRAAPLACVPAAALGTWFLYQWSQSLPVGYRAHGSLLVLQTRHLIQVLASMVSFLDAGSLWIPWVFGFSFLIPAARQWRRIAPALALTTGILVFLVFDYLHDAEVPRTRIEWTLPRVSQPALSAWILAAGLLALEDRGDRRTEPR